MEQFKKLTSDQYTLIDVRNPEEVAEGILAHAINIPLPIFESKIETIDKNKPVYLYCASGNRSGQAMNMLKDRGYDAYNLGGYMGLKDQI